MNEHIKKLDYEKLLALREELESGRFHERVKERIQQFENPHMVCPICNAPIDPEKDVTLHYGPEGLRYRATFDGYDCLRTFLASDATRFK